MKITLATIKKFIKQNKNNLYIKVNSAFNGMTDGVEHCEGGYVKAVAAPRFHENNLGIEGMWCVLGSRDYFTKIDNSEYLGYNVFNCCGSVDIVIKK